MGSRLRGQSVNDCQCIPEVLALILNCSHILWAANPFCTPRFKFTKATDTVAISQILQSYYKVCQLSTLYDTESSFCFRHILSLL
jgi:hypothetical protein